MMASMKKRTAEYTVRQVAILAGVSVRTLHHYDQIGLLRPSSRTAAGYRLYGEGDLLRLQQILFFKELDFPLQDIQRILDRPGFDQVEALEGHRRLLQKRMDRLAVLMTTIDNTIRRLEEDDQMLTDAELYEGFSQDQIDRYKREVREQYNPKLVEESERRVRKLSKAQWQAVGDEGKAVTQRMAELMDRDPTDPEVQATIARHHAWIENFDPCSAEVYRGLGQLYVEHPEFRAFYEAYAPNLADFMQAAMVVYADRTLAER
jgi:DNA-binding transcriptional MerR regulator